MLRVLGCALLLTWASLAAGAEDAKVRALQAEVKMWKAATNKLREENRQLKAEVHALRRRLKEGEAKPDGEKPEGKPDNEKPDADAGEGKRRVLTPQDLMAFEEKWHEKLAKGRKTRLQKDAIMEERAEQRVLLRGRRIKVTGPIKEVSSNKEGSATILIQKERPYRHRRQYRVQLFVSGVRLEIARTYKKGQVATFVGKLYRWHDHAGVPGVFIVHVTAAR